VRLELALWKGLPGGAEGAVQALDRFGNLISSLPGSVIADRARWSASIGGRTVPGHRTYGEVPVGEALALVGSHGFVEIAVHRGDARIAFGARVGDRVQVRWE